MESTVAGAVQDLGQGNQDKREEQKTYRNSIGKEKGIKTVKVESKM